MKTFADLLARPRFSHRAMTHASDIVNLHFESGKRINVLKTDPALDLLNRGDHVTFSNAEKRDICPGVQMTIYSIVRVERQAAIYAVD